MKYSSLSFSTASSLIFGALIRWILLLWLGVSLEDTNEVLELSRAW
jgi:hypothetical protein